MAFRNPPDRTLVRTAELQVVKWSNARETTHWGIHRSRWRPAVQTRGVDAAKGDIDPVTSCWRSNPLTGASEFRASPELQKTLE